MPRRAALVAAVVAVLIAALWWWRHPADHRPAERPPAAAAGDRPATAARPAAGGPTAPPALDRAAARARRDRMRDKIVAALAEHQARSRLDRSPPSASAAMPGAAGAAAEGDDPARPQLRDRIGGREALTAYLSADFMPLVDQCIELARVRDPRLTGMLALEVTTVAAEELGAVVDVAEAAPTNQVADPELLECVRESAYSLVFEPSVASGREAFELTLPL